MRANLFRCLGIVLFSVFFFSCKKETETIDDFAHQTERLTELLPLQPGKYIIYRLDSIVFVNFAANQEIHYYQEKQLIDAQITDNLGRPSYRVLRFLRDTAGTESWRSAGSYFITPTAKTIEIIENNLRKVKLATPVQQDLSWKGNQYLPTKPYHGFYNFSNDNAIANWEYSFSSVDETMVLNGTTINNVFTVSQVDESQNTPFDSSNPPSYASRTFAEDKYAKGIGLVYQELIMWEYQANLGNPTPYFIGFGIKRSMIDHN